MESSSSVSCLVISFEMIFAQMHRMASIPVCLDRITLDMHHSISMAAEFRKTSMHKLNTCETIHVRKVRSKLCTSSAVCCFHSGILFWCCSSFTGSPESMREDLQPS